ncbi:MAG: hypothetical protein COW24_03630 [Candidatus Kerfeldbacteria bacterium CG15_BIG_FIL_POST_REV_8_21_14_020_45_12]|uniref:Uncharacterized protein n=1 Tax=Candidatus Kerfeldbacteria bacterium CG15_BIG_FIL_POST_REV_8_21_14_020_45_12 TaxID=2014247 RepID=A0A2M7H3G3_9BACT|nr:MAG: hypothetical protein COW24_03630 [Candidatus Kerfeldbacteria bacterium CG15_BIG_FIL_POST_REV_8_21_14_020_45_12]PJA93760.1 MAG: hypothetical protein CO132_01825 [Candidatus Kerfeldbacteria bacterium CG_4_9_14_3_um_filter_45_8]
MPNKKPKIKINSWTIIAGSVVLLFVISVGLLWLNQNNKLTYSEAVVPIEQPTEARPNDTFVIDIESSILNGTLSPVNWSDDRGASRSLAGKPLEITFPVSADIDSFTANATIEKSNNSLLLTASCQEQADDGEYTKIFSTPLYLGNLEDWSQIALSGGGSLYSKSNLTASKTSLPEIASSALLSNRLIYIDPVFASRADLSDLLTPMLPASNKTIEYSTTFEPPLQIMTQASGDLLIEFEKFNINGLQDSDEMAVIINDATGKQIAKRTVPDDGVTNGRGKRTSQSISLSIPIPETGLYEISFSTGNPDNVRIKNLKLNTSHAVISKLSVSQPTTLYTETEAMRSIQLSVVDRTQVSLMNLETGEITNHQLAPKQHGESFFIDIMPGKYEITFDNKSVIYFGSFSESSTSFFTPFVFEVTQDAFQADILLSDLKISTDQTDNVSLELPINCTPATNDKNATTVTLDSVLEPTLRALPEAKLISERYKLYADLCGAYLYSSNALDLLPTTETENACDPQTIDESVVAMKLANLLAPEEEGFNYSESRIRPYLVSTENISTSQEKNTLSASIKGAVSGYFVAQGDLEFDFNVSDINRHSGSDDIVLEIIDIRQETVFSQIFPGDTVDTNSGIQTAPRHQEVKLAELSGLYQFKISELPYGSSSNDFIIDDLSINTDRVILNDTIRFVNSSVSGAVANAGGIEQAEFVINKAIESDKDATVFLNNSPITNTTGKRALDKIMQNSPVNFRLDNDSLTLRNADFYPFSPEPFAHEYFNPGTNFIISNYVIDWLIELRGLSFSLR